MLNLLADGGLPTQPRLPLVTPCTGEIFTNSSPTIPPSTPPSFEGQLVTASLTALLAILVYVAGQIIIRFAVDPVYEQKKVIGKIADALIYFSNIYGNPGLFGSTNEGGEASNRLRRLSSQLVSKTHPIPFYNLLALLRITRSKKEILSAHRGLIRLSNSISERHGDNIEIAYKIKKSLGIYRESKDGDLIMVDEL